MKAMESNTNLPEQPRNHFSSQLPVLVFHRPAGQTLIDWQELDRGPGYFTIPAGDEAGVRIKNIDDDTLENLIQEMAECPVITFINISENRKITNDGLQLLTAMRQISALNLSSCGITDAGLPHLKLFRHLTYLNLSYCNRLTDAGVKALHALTNLTFLDLQGCVKMTTAGMGRIERRGLTIHR